MIIEHGKPIVELELGDIVKYEYKSKYDLLKCDYGIVVYVKHSKFNYGVLDLESNIILNAHESLESLADSVDIVCKGGNARLII